MSHLPPAPQAQQTTLSGIRSLQDTKGHEVIPPTSPLRFTDVRVKVDMECEGISPEEIQALVTHVKKWSPVANTFTRPVNLEVGI